MSGLDANTAMQAPSFRLDGKRALVTGGSRGIGLAAAFCTGPGWRASNDRCS
ncbi:MAG: hypothetical protein LRY61_07405 [Burkholderiaceae bacterium]|nr:hypothetical protein [Burkholderiaceae bacterium]